MFILVTFLSVLIHPGHTQSYTVVDLGNLGGEAASESSDINASGQVVGRSWNEAYTNQVAVLFSGSGTGNINLDPSGTYSSAAVAINDLGQIVGESVSPTTIEHSPSSTIFDPSGIQNIYLDTDGSRASAINSIGEAVGRRLNMDATLYNIGASTQFYLGALTGYRYSGASDINDNGQVVGYGAELVSNAIHAVLFSRTGSGNLDLGTLGGSISFAKAINNRGQIVGMGQTSDNYSRATIFSGTGINNIDISPPGTISSVANDINDSGQIVGSSTSYDRFPTDRAFIYQNSIHTDLNTLIDPSAGVVITDAQAINNSGQIAATGMSTDFRTGFQRPHALRLDPILFTVNVVAKKGRVVGAGKYAPNTKLRLKAIPNKGRRFIQWREGKKVVSKKRIYEMTLVRSRNLTADFR